MTDKPSPNIILQPDDLRMFWHIYCNRLLDTEMIASLFPRSRQVITRRLEKLQMGADPYLHRLPQARQRTRIEERKGSDPEVYAIGRKAAEALRDHAGQYVPHLGWRYKNSNLKIPFITHELATARFMVRLWRDAELSEDDVSVEYQQELLTRLGVTPPSGKGLPNRLATPVQHWLRPSRYQATAADRIFSYTAGGRRHFIFLEIDEGTETVVPRANILESDAFWDRTSVLRKFVIYANAFRSKAHEELFKIPVFRVLTITTNQKRVATMQHACQRYLLEGYAKVRPGFFMFGSWEAITAHDGSLFTHDFQTATGEAVRLGG